MDDDDDYFTPMSGSSRRLAMLFSPEEMSNSSSSSITGHHSEPSTHFRFVAPKQPRPGRSNSSASNSSGTGQAFSSRDGQEVLLEVQLSLPPQGVERSTPRTQTHVRCLVVGNAVRRNFTLVVVVDKEEIWRTAIDSHLFMQVVDRTTLKVAALGKSLTLVGETQRIEALVTQVAVYRAVSSEGPTHQDVYVGKGHVLGEGDVAKVCCTTYTITSTAVRGEKVEDLKGAKVTVSPAAGGGWESCLVGAAMDTRRLIFLPKQKEGKWLPSTTYHDVTVMKVRTKAAKEKPTPAGGTPVISNNSSPAKTPQQQQMVPSCDSSATGSPQSFMGQNGDVAEPQTSHDTQEDDGASRKAALVSRMAQVGTPLFPLLPGGAKVVPQVAEVTTEAAAETREVTPEETSDSVPPSTLPSPPPTSLSSTTIPLSTTTSVSTSFPTYTPTPTSVLPTTAPTVTPAPAPAPAPSPAIPVSYPQAHSVSIDSTLALSICQLGTSVAKISDRVDLLLSRVDKIETGVPRRCSSPSTSDPETLMALASGLVAHNERLRADLETAERKLTESQTSCTSLLAMNTQLLGEKREMLRREGELSKKEEDKEEDNREDLNNKEDPVKEEKEIEEKETQTEKERNIQGLMPEQVKSLVKSTLSGVFHHLSATFSEEQLDTQPHILQTLRSALQVAYSNALENLEEMMGVQGREGHEAQEEEEEEEEEGKIQHEENKKEEDNGKIYPQVEIRNGETSPGQE